MLQITVTVGTGFDRHGVVIPPEVRTASLTALDNEAINRFGGYTRQAIDGGWKNAAGVTVQESGTTYIILSDQSSAIEQAREFAKLARAALNQESVLLKVEPVSAEFVQ